MNDWLDNVVDKNILQDTLTFTSIFIAVYEHMTDYVESNVEGFLNEIAVEDGKYISKKSKEYKSEIENKIVDEKGNKDKIKASFQWLVSHGAITSEEYERFLVLKAIRNKYAHELTDIIYAGVDKEKILLLFEMHSLYSKITRWFFIQIEAPLMGDEIPEDADMDKITNVANFLFNIILDVLYKGKSEEYKAMLTSIRDEINK